MTTAWLSRAACRGMDTALFFSTTGDYPPEAWAACARCPVARECLEDALSFEHNGRYDVGLRAGTTGHDRKQIRRQRRRKDAA